MANDPTTHMPHRNGPVCGLRPPPTRAEAYTVDEPSCEKCQRYWRAVQSTRRTFEPPPPPAQETPSRTTRSAGK